MYRSLPKQLTASDVLLPVTLSAMGDPGMAHIHGLARRAATICGTPGIIAPEVLACAGRGYDVAGGKSDVWSVGCCLLSML
jgi:serine/threonine protein kinase